MDRCRLTRALFLALAVCFLGGRPARAADQEEGLSGTILAGESSATARRLEAADKLAAQKKWADALDEYQRLLDEAGDVLVPLDAQRRQAVQARRLCHLRIAGLPAEALRLYRRRVEDQAKKWLKQGADERDSRLLRRVVDESFCSRAGEEALELLGDLAFERGRFGEAGHWWRMLARARTGKPTAAELVFPDPQPERVARVQAKLLIARCFQGDDYRLADDLKEYRTRHGQAAGRLAGAEGNYADIVAKIIKETAGHSLLEGKDVWTTFAGRPARSLMLPKPLPARISANGRRWGVRLDTGALEPPDEGRSHALDRRGVEPRAARFLAFHPLIAGDLVLWADARRVNAHDLKTGRRVFRYDLLTDGKFNDAVLRNVDLKVPAAAGLRYSLSAAPGRVYARLGTQRLAPKKDKIDPSDKVDQTGSESFLVCLSLDRAAPSRELWHVQARLLATDPQQVFEGAPLVHDGRVSIVLSRVEDGQTRSYVHCYDGETGKALWRQEVCETKAGPENQTGQARFLHHLLTLAGTQVVYCSHGGAIVALDAVTGQRAWGVRYASRGSQTAEGDPSPRDLAPCVYADGRVYAAPLDADRLLCLDADTGRLLWETARLEVVHLLGVARGKVIVTTPQGIRAVNAETGQTAWAQPDDGAKLPGYGRGLLAGGWVFYPTATGEPLRALNVDTGEPEKGAESFPPELFWKMERGNLVFGNGCLAVAGTEVLSVYVPEEMYLDERRAEANRPSAPASAFYRLALAEFGAGLYPDALSHFRRAEEAKPDEQFHGEAVSALARRGRHELLLHLAKNAINNTQWKEAADRLVQASAAEFPVAERLRALSLLGAMWPAAGRPERGVAVWQSILENKSLRRGHLVNTQGKSEPAGAVAAAWIKALVGVHGAAIYEPFEKKAKALLATARGERQAEVLDQLVREYPNASVTGSAALRLARLNEEAGRPVQAARAYRQALRQIAGPLKDEDMVMARAGLARSYEKQRCWETARAAWQKLADEAGDRTVVALDPRAKVREYVARQLGKAEYHAADRPPPLALELPLLRTWPASLDEGPVLGKLVVPTGRVDKGVIFFARDAKPQAGDAKPQAVLDCREAATGKPRWERPVSFRPTWAAFQGETVLVAGAAGVQCRGLSDGRLVWEFVPAAPLLAAFRLTRTRLFCLQGEGRLWALDAAGGRVLWDRWAPGARVRPASPAGRFNPHYHAGEQWLVVLTGGKRLVLDAGTGRVLHEAPAGAPWQRPLLALDERRLVVAVDARHVVLFDPAVGKELWAYSPAARGSTTLTGEPPRLLGGADTLLLLVARNYGYQLERLDPATGRPLWKPRARIIREALDAGQVGVGAKAVFYVSRGVLTARSLADGKLLWSQPLDGPAGAWRAVCSPRAVLAIPVRRSLRPSWYWVPLGDVPLALPIRLPAGRGLAVLVHDPETGRLVQRLNFPSPVSAAGVQVLPHRLVVEVAGRAWGLTDSADGSGRGGRSH